MNSCPKDWRTTTVAEACSIRNDLRLPVSRHDRMLTIGPYPYYGPTGQLDAIDTYRLDGTFALIGEDGDHFLDAARKPQTILVSGKFNVNNHAHVIASTSICAAEWFYNYFRHRSLKPYLTRQGAGRYKLNKAALQELEITLPSVNEQAAINALFRQWDTAIQKTEQLIAAKEQLHNALAGQLLFGLTRLRRHGASTSKSLHWFSISNDWSTVAIGAIAREVSDINDTNDSLPVLSCTKYDGLVNSLEYFKKRVFSHNLANYKVVRRGQFAYATNHIEEGSIGYQNMVAAGLVSPIYTVFETDRTRVDDEYLFKLLKTERLRQLFAANTNASVDRRGSLRWSEFARIHIPLPPLGEQRDINDALNTSKQEIDLLRAEVAALQRQKRGLMQRLLTGKWRLPVHEEEAV